MATVPQQQQARLSGRPNLISDFADPPFMIQRRGSQRQGSVSSNLADNTTQSVAAASAGRRTSLSGSAALPSTAATMHRRGSSASMASARTTSSSAGGHGRSMSVSAVPDISSNTLPNGVLDSKAEKRARRQARKEKFATGALAYSGKAGAASLGAGLGVGLAGLCVPFAGLVVGPVAGITTGAVCTCLSGAPVGIPAYLYLKKHGKGEQALDDVHQQYSESWKKWKGRGKRAGHYVTCGMFKD